MENASKALIIAGAILISILLISVGIVIFNSSSSLFGSAKTSMSEQEISMFNQKFTMYEGTNISGSQVRELFRVVRTNDLDNDNADVTINGITPDNDSTITVTTTGKYTVATTTDNNGVINAITVTDPANGDAQVPVTQ